MSSGEVLGYVFLAVGLALTFAAGLARLRELRALEPEATPMQISGMHDSCDWCQREIPDGCYGVLCSECDTKAHDALDPAPPSRPAQDAVREAAEPFEFIRAMAGAKCSWTPAEGTTSCDGFGGVCAGHQAERWLAARGGAS